jgi:branched-chain amino acid transport system ATP-binding protein
MEVMLSVRDLEVRYGRGVSVVKDYAVDLMPGTVTVILGRNGAGKTSTLRGIVGFLPHEDAWAGGTVCLKGTQLRRRDPYSLSKAGVTLVAERDKVFAGLRVLDQLRLFAADRQRLEEVLEYFPRLAERGAVRAGLLSGGERQMLATALALLRRPAVMLVDELSLGLAPAMAADLMAYLRRLADREGLAILAADQAVGASLGVADAVQVMESGVVVATGPPGELGIDAITDAIVGSHG